MYDKLGWLTIEQLIAYHSLIAVYRIRMSKAPEYLAKQLTRENRQGKIIVNNIKLEQYRKSFIFRSSVLWNSLPASVREEQIIGGFKKQLRDWIKEQFKRF